MILGVKLKISYKFIFHFVYNIPPRAPRAGSPGLTIKTKSAIDCFHILIFHWSICPAFITLVLRPYFSLSILLNQTQSSYVKLIVARDIPWFFCLDPSCIIQWAKPKGVINSPIHFGIFFSYYLQLRDKMSYKLIID